MNLQKSFSSDGRFHGGILGEISKVWKKSYEIRRKLKEIFSILVHALLVIDGFS